MLELARAAGPGDAFFAVAPSNELRHWFHAHPEEWQAFRKRYEMELAMMKTMLQQQIDKESDAFYATARLWDDGIIDPRDTRRVLAASLRVAANAPVVPTRFPVFRM